MLSLSGRNFLSVDRWKQVESRLSRLASDYKATTLYMTREPCTPSFQDRGRLFMEDMPEQKNGLQISPENIGHCFIIKQLVLSFLGLDSKQTKLFISSFAFCTLNSSAQLAWMQVTLNYLSFLPSCKKLQLVKAPIAIFWYQIAYSENVILLGFHVVSVLGWNDCCGRGCGIKCSPQTLWKKNKITLIHCTSKLHTVGKAQCWKPHWNANAMRWLNKYINSSHL